MFKTFKVTKKNYYLVWYVNYGQNLENNIVSMVFKIQL